ncbi:MAG: cob(I)yrinic acid a,c-diamide adenosyltransferase [Bacteroidales bacterium]|jgi:cob(I)alamin adenosyltransferase|nr:cob(I)yrinic acid a,c-diamide adenosyltransferase [Bacteroidales bacterium]
MKVYTKTGDKGKTALIGGKRVKKDHPRIEAYGTVDELMAHVALLMDLLNNKNDQEFLSWILERLMTISSILAAEGDIIKKIPELKPENVVLIEKKIDEMEAALEPLHSFILPGGHPVISQCHIVRTVCRRTERVIVALESEYSVPDPVNEYINRLSDYFFVLSRKIAKELNIMPKNWTPIVD